MADTTTGTSVAIATPDLKIIDGQITTTSLQIAEHFGKQHKDVLRAIKNLLKELPEGYQRNFALIQIDVDLGMGRTRKDPAYRITRDGFTLLAMGFTGKEALQWKLAYITAFNAMEAELLRKAPYTTQPGDTLNEAQQIALRALLESNVKRLPMGRRGEAMRQGWSKLKSHFKVPYRQIPASEFEEALSIIARHIAQWELVDESTQPAIQSQAALQLPRLDLHMQPPPVGTYRYNPANPYPRNGRTIEVAKSIALDILNWSDHLPTTQARQDLHDAAQTLHDLLVSGWTEVDEALSKMHTAMHFLNRWQGRGGTVGNCS